MAHTPHHTHTHQYDQHARMQQLLLSQRSSAAVSRSAVKPTSRSQLQCHTCGSTSFRENELGFWICCDCGAQSADRMALTNEVEEEMWSNLGNLMRTGTRLRRSPKQAKLSEDQAELVRSQVLLHGFHSLLQLQARSLVFDFNVPSTIIGVIGRLWVSYISYWRESPPSSTTSDAYGWGSTHTSIRVARRVPGTTNVAVAASSTVHSNKQQKDDTLNQDTSEDEKASKRGVKRFRSDREDLQPTANALSSTTQLQVGEISPSLSIALLYIGCQLVREAITMQQLCTWIQLGKLPYFHYRSFPASLISRIESDHLLMTFFQPQACPSAHRLMQLAQQTAHAVAFHMDCMVQTQAQQGEEAMPHARLAFQQAHDLRRLFPSGPTSLGRKSPVDSVSSFADSSRGVALSSTASTSTSTAVSSLSTNRSLLIRTWLSDLHLNLSLHPFIMELIDELRLSSAANLLLRHPQMEGTEVQEHVRMMACVVIAVELTQDSVHGIGISKLPSNAEGSFFGRLPRTVYESRSLPAANQSTFLDWMSSVGMARFQQPQQFDFVLDAIQAGAQSQSSSNRKDSANAKSDSVSSMSDSTGALSREVLLSRVAQAQVTSYSSLHRGFFHPAYSGLVRKCCSAIGISASSLHAMIERLVKLARVKYEAETQFVDPRKTSLLSNYPQM